MITGLFLATVLAVSPYVLPYPGAMPGNKVYALRQIIDTAGQYWAFGSFARHQYELALSDKKLVEAKVLFEYHQYPLALAALESSNSHFKKAAEFLAQAGREGKDIAQKKINFRAAGAKHQEILTALEATLPEKFFWQPEKSAGQELHLKSALEEAIKIREI